jgi:carboxylesterase type B
MFGTKGLNTDAEFLAVVKAAGPDDATANTIPALYPDIPAIGIPGTLKRRPQANTTYGYQWKRAAAYGGDLVQHAPRRLVSQSWAAQNVSVWTYHFNVWVNGLDAETGVTHFQEVVFVFDNTNGLGYETAVAVNPLRTSRSLSCS